MKKRVLLFFVCIFMIGTSQKSKPDLRSTMSWIIGKLEGSYKVPYSDYRFQNISYDYKKNILYIRKDKNNDPTYEIPLIEINPNNIEVEIFENELRGGMCANITIYTVGGKGNITASYSDATNNFKMRGLPIIIPDNTLRSEHDLPERLKLAFKSAIETLTGKTEVF